MNASAGSQRMWAPPGNKLARRFEEAGLELAAREALAAAIKRLGALPDRLDATGQNQDSGESGNRCVRDAWTGRRKRERAPNHADGMPVPRPYGLSVGSAAALSSWTRARNSSRRPLRAATISGCSTATLNRSDGSLSR